MAADIKALLAAISPAMRPTLLMNNAQSAAVQLYAPGFSGAVITAPYMPAGQVVAVDAAAFASALGVPEFLTDENPTVHMNDTPLPIGTVGTPPVVAAPTQSLWQTACIGLRTLIDCDWLLRRTGAVAVCNGGVVIAMTSHLPNDYAEDRVRRSPARQSDELRHMLTAIKTDWQRELTNISMAAFWPDIERAVIALNDSDANRRSNAVDRLLDGIERAVQTCHTRLAKCDAAAGPVHRSVHK